jgi:predicted Holliday junction resolvase-like endonuclease
MQDRIIKILIIIIIIIIIIILAAPHNMEFTYCSLKRLDTEVKCQEKKCATRKNKNHNGYKPEQEKAENILKYKDLRVDSVNVEHKKVSPVIRGTTGIVSELFRECLSDLTEKHNIKEVQKTAII